MTTKVLSPWRPMPSPDDRSVARFQLDGTPVGRIHYYGSPIVWRRYHHWISQVEYKAYHTLKGAKRDIDRHLKAAGYRFLSEDEYQKLLLLA